MRVVTEITSLLGKTTYGQAASLKEVKEVEGEIERLESKIDDVESKMSSKVSTCAFNSKIRAMEEKVKSATDCSALKGELIEALENGTWKKCFVKDVEKVLERRYSDVNAALDQKMSQLARLGVTEEAIQKIFVEQEERFRSVILESGKHIKGELEQKIGTTVEMLNAFEQEVKSLKLDQIWQNLDGVKDVQIAHEKKVEENRVEITEVQETANQLKQAHDTLKASFHCLTSDIQAHFKGLQKDIQRVEQMVNRCEEHRVVLEKNLEEVIKRGAVIEAKVKMIKIGVFAIGGVTLLSLLHLILSLFGVL